MFWVQKVYAQYFWPMKRLFLAFLLVCGCREAQHARADPPALDPRMISAATIALQGKYDSQETLILAGIDTLTESDLLQNIVVQNECMSRPKKGPGAGTYYRIRLTASSNGARLPFVYLDTAYQVITYSCTSGLQVRRVQA